MSEDPDFSSTDHPSHKRGLISELRRRKVFRAGGAYLVVAWLVIQAASIVSPSFDLPSWTMRMVITMAALGFPLVVVLAWAFELTPEGMKRTPESEEGPVDKTQNRKRNLAAFGLGALVPSLGFLILFAFLLLRPSAKVAEEPITDRSIAVLPFTNLSADEENAFFAGGVHEDILTNLAKINDLQVISRTSVMRYQDKPDNLRKIGEELGAHFIVEGSVRRAGEDIRITIQLIDAKTDQHLYAENFDRKLENIFALQSAIAKEIAGILKARLSPEDTARLDVVPTNNIAAYDAYLKARQVISFDWEEFDILRGAIDSLVEATEKDPQFVEAWGLLVQAYGQLGWQLNAVEDAEKEIEQTAQLLDKALATAQAINPEHPATLRAEGYYYYMIKRDYLSAFQSTEKALTLFPNDVYSINFLGYIYRRLNQPDKAIAQFKKAFVLDRANVSFILDLIRTYEISRKYQEMVPLYQQLAVLEPEKTNFLIEAKYYQFMSDGSLESFKAFEDSLVNVQKTEKCNLSTWQNGNMTCAMIRGEFDKYSEEWKAKWQAHYEGHGDWVCPVQINEEANHAALMLREGDPELAREVTAKALHEITLPIKENSGCLVDTALIMPKLHLLSGNPELAREEFDKALIKINQKEESFRKMWEKMMLLEAADIVAPDRVFAIYQELANEPTGIVSLELICTNPWSFSSLVNDPQFQSEVRKDGRFVNFLEHYEFM